jgi:hypothetical protein
MRNYNLVSNLRESRQGAESVRLGNLMESEQSISQVGNITFPAAIILEGGILWL